MIKSVEFGWWGAMSYIKVTSQTHNSSKEKMKKANGMN